MIEADWLIENETVIQTARTAPLDAGTGGRITLRIGVDEKDAVAPTGDDGGEVDRGRGLTDSAFLIRYGYGIYGAHPLRVKFHVLPHTLPQNRGTRETCPPPTRFLLGGEKDQQG